MLRIVLTDVNDNPPVFQKSHYYTDIRENSRSGSIQLVTYACTSNNNNNNNNDDDDDDNCIVLLSFSMILMVTVQ